MEEGCPRCGEANRREARFCAGCGLSLALGIDGTRSPGRVGQPRARAAPAGFAQCDGSADLYCRWSSSWGGEALAGTEPLDVDVFNGGYGLSEVRLRVRGLDESGSELFAIDKEIERLPSGETVRIEVPSWELPAAAPAWSVALVSARYEPQD
jgi:hypothetical protein